MTDLPQMPKGPNYHGRFLLTVPEAGLLYLAEAELDVSRLHNRHSHKEIQVLWVLEGAMGMELGGVRSELVCGSACVIPPGLPHRVVPPMAHDAGRDARAVLIDLRLRDDPSVPMVAFLATIDPDGSPLPGPVVEGNGSGVPESASRVRAAAALDGPERTARLLAGSWSLLADLAAAARRGPSTGRADGPGQGYGDAADYRLRAAERFMRDRLADPIGVEDVAAGVGLSRSQLSRICLARWGVGPAERLRQLRVERAGQLLRTTTLSIKEVARVCGFTSQNHFSRVFADLTGTAPSALRGVRR